MKVKWLVLNAATVQCMDWLSGCAPTWTKYSDTDMDGGTSSSSSTVSDCLTVCYHNTSCTAVDWVPGESVGRQCWLHGSGSRGARRSRAGVQHFSISRPTTCNGNHQCCFIYTFIVMLNFCWHIDVHNLFIYSFIHYASEAAHITLQTYKIKHKVKTIISVDCEFCGDCVQ